MEEVTAAERWLHGARRRIRDWAGDGPSGAEEGEREHALAGLEALVVAGAFGEDAAVRWRAVLAGADGEVAGAARSPAAEACLGELLAAVGADPEWDDPAEQRFEGALHLLAAVGAADAREWDARLRDRTGRPSADEEHRIDRELNAGGTEAELVGVLAGPPEVRGGYRLLLVLRFADAVVFLLDKDEDGGADDEWAGWRATDDLGTRYRFGGGGGGSADERVRFTTAPPPGAAWVELALEGRPEVVFRVAL